MKKERNTLRAGINNKLKISRRKFLLNSGKAAATIVSASAFGIPFLTTKFPGDSFGADLINLHNSSLLTGKAGLQSDRLPVTAVADTTALMPKHGTVSTAAATKWEDSLASGNGIMGALLAGNPVKDTLIVNHCKLWLPLGSREIVPDVGAFLPEMRRIIGEKGYGAGHQFFLEKAKEQGWDGNLVWTDPFHPGFLLTIDHPAVSDITEYARIEDFSTGEVRVQWHTEEGDFFRRMFVSRTDNVIVLQLAGPKSGLTCKLYMEKIGNKLIDSSIVHSNGLITCHNVYVNGKGGYDGVVRITTQGGLMKCDGEIIDVNRATSITLVIRIQPWKIPLPGSEAWPYSTENPEFLKGTPTLSQKAAKSYQPQWMEQLKSELTSLSSSYGKLLKLHAKVHSGIFNRVSLDLGASPSERGLSSEALLDIAQKEKILPAALLERMYDAGRYVFLCSAGPDTPPNLFGIWTGTWQPAWSGDYTLDTNIELDIESALSGNMAECLAGYFRLMESFVPDFHTNARKLYGCRGILTGSRASNTGIHLHWNSSWPGEVWTPGAPWLAHWFYDYYQYTGNKKFLVDHAVPWMKECALFYEDFLKGTEDTSGHYTFCPSFSAENGWADNSTQDISICRELLNNLVTACEILGIEQENTERWKEMLAKLPPYLINSEGQLKEWSTPNKEENNNHRHLMHLYGAFESDEFSVEADPELFQAAQVALLNRIKFARETSTHGYMHSGLAATGLGMGNEAYSRLRIMAIGRSMYPSMVTSHEPGPRILCDDGNGAIPQIINRMIVQSRPGRITLLPALPTALPHGSLSGTLARGQISLDLIQWDIKTGVLNAKIMSDVQQEIDLVLPSDIIVNNLSVNGNAQGIIHLGKNKQGCKLMLPKAKPVVIETNFTFKIT